MKQRIRLSSTPEISEQENILPLINIVFLLLIFFMIAGTFRASELFSVKVPIVTVAPLKSEKITVLMNAQGEFAIERKAFTGSELTRHLKIHFTESSTEPWVILKADANANAEQLLRTMEFFNEAGATSLQLLTIKEP